MNQTRKNSVLKEKGLIRQAAHLMSGRAGVLGGLLLTCCSILPGPAVAAVQADMQFPHALTPIFRWAEPVEMHLSGIPVVVRGFVSTQSLEQAAQSMARHKKRFQRVTTLPGSILLSGTYLGQHWVAQMDAVHGQVQGMVSALPLEYSDTPKNTETPGFLRPWLTQNARFVFGHSSIDSGQAVKQSIYVPNDFSAGFSDALGRHLADAGWRRSGAHSWLSAKGSNASRIDLFPVRDPQAGQAIFIQHSE